jgi:two-component system, NtrC family, response regulator HydG
MLMTDSAQCRILLVDDEEGLRLTLGLLLKNEGYRVDTAAGHVAAIVCLQTTVYDLAFVDIMLAGESGIDLLRDIKTISPLTQVVMFTGHPEVDSAVAAVRLGAFDYITKPVRKETLMLIARHALKNKQMHDDLEQSRANMDAILRTVDDSIVMVDKEGCLAHFNSTAEKVCGYTRDLIGSEAAAINLGCGGFCRTVLLEALSGKTSREIRRHECRTPGGKNRVVGLTATPVIEADGTVNGAVAVIRDESRVVALEQALQKRERFQGIVGASMPMQKVYSLIEDLADVPSTVLIYGESGTGKELVASALHYSGTRASGPFVKVNCSALSESLLESELFGHVRGAFTGAIANKVGRFQKADKGTLFLDEIADISPAIQMRLLRVLQEGEFERVGESTSRKVDVRMLAATNRDLAAMVKQGTFREDLYYRLDVVRVRVPPLRKRLDDLDLLVAHFIAKFNKKLKREIQGVSGDVMTLFHHHAWPGNVRELEHAVEHASILCKSNIITVQDLPQDLIDSPRADINPTAHHAALPTPGNKKLTLEEALLFSGGNKTHAANLLGVSRLTVYRQMKKSGQK